MHCTYREHWTPFYHIELCNGLPKKIENAKGTFGSGYLDGDTLNYTCSGQQRWSGGVRGVKSSTCEKGKWTEVNETCSGKYIKPMLHKHNLASIKWCLFTNWNIL